MWTERGRRFTLVLMFLVMNCLSSCTPVSSDYCPVYPVAGEKVAAELKQAGDLPATWEWIGRIDKLRRELKVCRD